jgi:hypothetical protein
MGHKRVEITMRYAHLSPKHKAKAVALLMPPKNPDGIHDTPSEAGLATA